jgi:hypothetical protein
MQGYTADHRGCFYYPYSNNNNKKLKNKFIVRIPVPQLHQKNMYSIKKDII